MSSVGERPATNGVKTLRGLRANSLAAVVTLVLEFCLGVGINLYTKLPASDSKKALFPAFGRAVTGGPLLLTLHALLGTILLISAVSALIRSLLTRRPLWIAISGVALLAVIAAWLAGSRFVGDGANGTSLAMAIATGVTILSYAIILFVVPDSARLEQTELGAP